MEINTEKVLEELQRITEELSYFDKMKGIVNEKSDLRISFTVWINDKPENFSLSDNRRSIIDIIEIKERQLLEEYRKLSIELINFK